MEPKIREFGSPSAQFSGDWEENSSKLIMLAQKWQPEGQTYPWTDVTSRGWFGAHEEKYISSLKKNLESYYWIEKKGEKRKRKEK